MRCRDALQTEEERQSKDTGMVYNMVIAGLPGMERTLKGNTCHQEFLLLNSKACSVSAAAAE